MKVALYQIAPKGFKGRPMSVSDVIEFSDSEEGKNYE